jgi:hypothetical protein
VARLVEDDAYWVQVLGNDVFEILGLVRWVGVVKPTDENAVGFLVCQIIIEERRLGVPDVKIAGRLRRETGDYGTVDLR